MDPLEDVFRSMRVESALYGRLEATAPWAVSFEGDQRIKFGMVAEAPAGCRSRVSPGL